MNNLSMYLSGAQTQTEARGNINKERANVIQQQNIKKFWDDSDPCIHIASHSNSMV